MPDPQDEATYHRSKLDWDERRSPRGKRMLSVYRRLAALRREHPELTAPSFADCSADEETRVFTMRRGALTVVVNFGEEEQAVADRRRRSSSSRPSRASTSRGRHGHRCPRTPAASSADLAVAL